MKTENSVPIQYNAAKFSSFLNQNENAATTANNMMFARKFVSEYLLIFIII